MSMELQFVLFLSSLLRCISCMRSAIQTNYYYYYYPNVANPQLQPSVLYSWSSFMAFPLWGRVAAVTAAVNSTLMCQTGVLLLLLPHLYVSISGPFDFRSALRGGSSSSDRISGGDQQPKLSFCRCRMSLLSRRLTHLCGPELHQHGLPLRLLVGPLLLQQPPVGMKPRARPRVLGQTRWGQKLPQSLPNTLGCPLLLCQINIVQEESEWVTGKT